MTSRKKRATGDSREDRTADRQDVSDSDLLRNEVLDVLLESERSPFGPETASSADRITEIAQSAVGADELATSRDLLRRVRAWSRRSEWSPKRERHLIQRVLGQTTNLDPSWRGDLRLVLGFVRESFSRSSQLRTAAALLFVLCFMVLPAVAWIVLQPKRVDPYFNTGIEPPPVVLPEGDTEQVELELPDDFVSSDAEQHRLDREQNTRRQARFLLLTQVGLPALEDAAESDLEPFTEEVQPGAPIEAILFGERLRLMRGAGAKYSLQSLEHWVSTPAQQDLLALLALDRSLILGRSDDLGRILNRLALEEAEGTANALALHVLARARAQGDWPQAPPQGWAKGGPRIVLPLGQGEEQALESVFGESLHSLRVR